MFLNQRDQYGFFQIINNVSGYYAEFRSKMTFRDDILSDAQKTFDTLNEKNKCSKKTKCTVVYVHMRMADYTHHMEALKLGPDVFNKTNYLQEAFKHVDQNHKVNAAKSFRQISILVSKQNNWCLRFTNMFIKEELQCFGALAMSLDNQM